MAEAPTVQPPNYQKQYARIGRRCDDCIYVVKGADPSAFRCKRFNVDVKWDWFSDDWDHEDGPTEYV